MQAITGPDAGDLSSVPSHLDFDANASVEGLKVGYFPAWMKENPATDVDRAALETVRKLKMVPTEVSLPDWPYDSLLHVLFSEAAAAFEELTLSGDVNKLKAQLPDAWPNLFRETRFLSAVDFVQTDRFRRQVAMEMARIFSQVDLLLVPSLRDEMLTLSNFTGHPSLTLRAGFVNVSEARSDWAPDPKNPLPKFNPPRRVPHGVTLLGRLFDEGTVARAGLAMERAFGVVAERPPGFYEQRLERRIARDAPVPDVPAAPRYRSRSAPASFRPATVPLPRSSPASRQRAPAARCHRTPATRDESSWCRCPGRGWRRSRPVVRPPTTQDAVYGGRVGRKPHQCRRRDVIDPIRRTPDGEGDAFAVGREGGVARNCSTRDPSA